MNRAGIREDELIVNGIQRRQERQDHLEDSPGGVAKYWEKDTKLDKEKLSRKECEALVPEELSFTQVGDLEKCGGLNRYDSHRLTCLNAWPMGS